jgi:LCP family protein required for cell wall assembly
MENFSTSKPVKDRKWLKITLIVLAVFLVAGLAFAIKTGVVLNKISGGGIFKSIVKSLPGVENKLKGEEEGRINVLLLGMRGENVPGGGLLADTIMVASVKIGATPAENKASMISIPRDLWVDNPGWGNKTKINAVFAAGEENGKKQGLADMKKVVSDITGIPIHYGVTINFQGFTDLVNAIGGIDVTLTETFEEPLQFNEPHVCDPNVFTKPTGKFEYKYDHKTDGRVQVVAQYPLCTNPNVECGGNFKLPVGANHLDGNMALCYARARYTSNDFERAKRQQLVIKLIKEKALSVGTLTDFNKVNGILNSLGDNAKTDMEPWEMKRFFDLYQKVGDNVPILQHVLENTEEGLLYAPQATAETGYILAPRGDNYDKVRELFKNVFDLPSQSDIKK